MWTPEEKSEIIAKAKAEQIIREEAKKERDVKIIEASNKLSEWLKKVQEFLALNENRLIGKKLFLTDGSKSKFFNDFTDELFNTFDLGRWDNCYICKSGSHSELKMSITVFGGKDRHENGGINTKYNVTVERTVYNIVKYDSDFKYVSFDTKAMLKKYTYDEYVSAQKEVDEINKQIKALETLRSDVKNNIPACLM